MTRPPIDVGDLLEWQGVPVLVIETPRFERPNWLAKVVYVRKYTPHGHDAWSPLAFHVDNGECGWKQRWTGELTDDEHSKIMQMLLTGKIL